MLARSSEVNHAGWGCCQQAFPFNPAILLISFVFFFHLQKSAFPTKRYFHFFFFFCTSFVHGDGVHHLCMTLRATHTHTHVVHVIERLPFSASTCALLLRCEFEMKVWDQTHSERLGLRSDIPVPNGHCESCAQNINKNEEHLQKTTGLGEEEGQTLAQMEMFRLIPSAFHGCEARRNPGGTSAHVAAAWQLRSINQRNSHR